MSEIKLAYVERVGNRQTLYRVIIRGRNWLGNPIARVVEVSHEIIPEDVMITLGCFGDVGNWQSKYYEVISAQHRMQKLPRTDTEQSVVSSASDGTK